MKPLNDFICFAFVALTIPNSFVFAQESSELGALPGPCSELNLIDGSVVFGKPLQTLARYEKGIFERDSGE